MGLRIERGAPRASPTPPGEGGAQSLAAAKNEVAQRIHRGDELRVDLPRVITFGLQECSQFAVYFGVQSVVERMNRLISCHLIEG
jgi:hypothetical protein